VDEERDVEFEEGGLDGSKVSKEEIDSTGRSIVSLVLGGSDDEQDDERDRVGLSEGGGEGEGMVVGDWRKKRRDKRSEEVEEEGGKGEGGGRSSSPRRSFILIQ